MVTRNNITHQHVKLARYASSQQLTTIYVLIGAIQHPSLMSLSTAIKGENLQAVCTGLNVRVASLY